jgi:hypothetical protein
MKRIFLLVAVLSLGRLSAQISLHSSDFASSGDSVRISYSINGTATVDHTLTGPNFLWDFSALQPGAQQVYRFTTPTAIPFNFLSDFGVVNPSPDSLPGIGSIPTDFTDYYKNSSSSYRENGLSFTYAPLGNFQVPVIFTASDYIYRFPLNYGNTDSSDAHYSFNIPNLLFFGQDIHRHNNVDGWGTVITPFGSFPCLRIVSVVDRVDTIGIDSTTGFSNARPTEVQYKWLASGMKMPVLEVDAQILFNAVVVTNVIYQDSLRDSVFQVGMSEAGQQLAMNGIYPNPATGQCVVSYQLSEAGTVQVSVYDLAGRLVIPGTAQVQAPGNHIEPIVLSGLAPGLYQIRIQNGNALVTSLLIIGN